MTAQPKDMGLPTTAYYAKDEIREVGLILWRMCMLCTPRKPAVSGDMWKLNGMFPFLVASAGRIQWMPDTLQDGTQKSQKVFVNIPTEVGATEAEEIGESSRYISNRSIKAALQSHEQVELYLAGLCNTF